MIGLPLHKNQRFNTARCAIGVDKRHEILVLYEACQQQFSCRLRIVDFLRHPLHLLCWAFVGASSHFCIRVTKASMHCSCRRSSTSPLKARIERTPRCVWATGTESLSRSSLRVP